jgi:hypothetical protein
MYGAAAARQDAMGYTAQDYAVQSNHMEVVQLLFHTTGILFLFFIFFFFFLHALSVLQTF